MEKAAYKITVGSISIQNEKSEASLISLSCELSALSCFCYCAIEISITNHLNINIYDEVTIELGSKYDKVFTGFVTGIKYSLTSILIKTCSNEKKLNEFHHNKTFKENYAGDIIQELASSANVETGKIEKGSNLLNYRISKSINIMSYLKELAWISGSYIYFDSDGKLNSTKAGSETTTHECKIAENVITYNIDQRNLAFEAIEVWGESASSTSGSDRWHWLVKDLASVYGVATIDSQGNVIESKTDNNLKKIRFGSIKNGESASKSASAIMTLEAERKYRGRIEIIGDPKIKLLDIINLTAPTKQNDFIIPNNKFRVLAISHSICSKNGFVTTLEI